MFSRARKQGREGKGREGRRTRRGRIETALEWNISLSFLSCRSNLKSDRGLNTITDPSAAHSKGKARLGSSVKLERLVDGSVSISFFFFFFSFYAIEK